MKMTDERMALVELIEQGTDRDLVRKLAKGSNGERKPSNLAVPGMICINPIAPASLIAQNL